MTKIFVVRREGGSRVLSMTKVLPKDWLAVEISVIKKTDGCITMKIEKVKY